VRDVDLLETIRESILMLEPDLTIRFANRSFCHTLAIGPELPPAVARGRHLGQRKRMTASPRRGHRRPLIVCPVWRSRAPSLNGDRRRTTAATNRKRNGGSGRRSTEKLGVRWLARASGRQLSVLSQKGIAGFRGTLSRSVVLATLGPIAGIWPIHTLPPRSRNLASAAHVFWCGPNIGVV
jgi:hypothetical protein